MCLAFCLGNAEESYSPVVTAVKAAALIYAVVCFKYIYPTPTQTIYTCKCNLVCDVALGLPRKTV